MPPDDVKDLVTGFVYALWLACRSLVNQRTLFAGIANGYYHHAQKPRLFRCPVNPVKQSPDRETLLFASGNALVQLSPMLIIPVLVPLTTPVPGASPNPLPWLFCGGGDCRLPVYENDWCVNLRYFCSNYGYRFNPRFNTMCVDTGAGQSEFGAIYYFIYRCILQSFGFIIGGYGSVP